jgi:hypothetical protein
MVILEGGSGGNHSAVFGLFSGTPKATLVLERFSQSMTGLGPSVFVRVRL